MPDLDALWQFICDKFHVTLSQVTYNTWIAAAKPIQFTDNTFVLEVPSVLHQDYWKQRLVAQVLQLIEDNFQQQITFLVMTPDQENPLASADLTKTAEAEESSLLRNSPLNKSYTFESFVVGDGNQMAHAAALAVSEELGTLYNPLYFYGGVGLGKTHLMHAIGNQLLKNRPKAKVKYVSSETFTNDFVNSIKNKQQEEFRRAYRNVDLLLVDDVQFFAKKPGTIDEFFHTFNDLYDDKKQIVLSSDRLPNMIENLGDRLISRFKWGLPVEITPPDYETRIAILETKATSEKLAVPNDVLKYIAGQFETNVRELEGGLTSVKAYAQMKKEPITIKLADEALKSLTGSPQDRVINISQIQMLVAKYYNVSLADIKGKKRVKRIVIPRQVAMYLSREATDASLPKIGREFGGKDHTTVLHACDKITAALSSDSKLRRDISDLKKQLNGEAVN
ncbi:chromosomal replication initiator protein DnaA [Ligilactobacillus sp. WILCCON 0076]|uniref:Chromosomal replication initiator protein DnaA n=1 Tax=Ligilactobacillus ubinensis TaxID=2876789 RepID=A0A9X2FKW2_9LACO|nr:chromosomal replication initiator protein DnaA [Ligilactobacillus ubinensis]MCP0887079.1 chromosomal replication initiator protein DnaA [Ligilactobacillus ubinensis]